MKKLILVIFILALCFTGKTQPPPIDTSKAMKLIVPADSVAIVSLADFTQFFKWLQDNASKSAYDKLTPDQVLSQFMQWCIVQYNEKKKKR